MVLTKCFIYLTAKTVPREPPVN